MGNAYADADTPAAGAQRKWLKSSGIALLGCGLGIGLVAVVIWLPHLLLDTFDINTPNDRLKAINDFRGTLVTLLGGIAVAVGTLVAALNLLQTRRAFDASQGQTRLALELTQRGQVTERFSKAIDQLGSEELEIRLGGIYALEQIAHDSQDLGRPIVEILTAFVRMHSRQDRGSIDWTKEESPRADFQAIATVLGRRNILDDELGRRLDLRGTVMRGVDFRHAQLQRADFRDAQLQDAVFFHAQLKDADFTRANLTHADFWEAERENTNFSDAIGYGG